MGDGNTLAEFNEERGSYGVFKAERTIYPLKDDYVKKLAEEITRLENKANSLQEKVYEERRKASDEEYKRYLLENLIKEHNKRSWWGRAEKIELKTEE